MSINGTGFGLSLPSYKSTRRPQPRAISLSQVTNPLLRKDTPTKKWMPSIIITGHPDDPNLDGTGKTVAQEVQSLHKFFDEIIQKKERLTSLIKTWIGYDGDRAPGEAPAVAIKATSMNILHMMSWMDNQSQWPPSKIQSEKIKHFADELSTCAQLLAAVDTCNDIPGPQVEVYNKQFWINQKTPESYLSIKRQYIQDTFNKSSHTLTSSDIWRKIDELHSKINQESKILKESMKTYEPELYNEIRSTFSLPSIALAQPRLCATKVQDCVLELMIKSGFKLEKDIPQGRSDKDNKALFELIKIFFDYCSTKEGKEKIHDVYDQLSGDNKNTFQLFKLYASMGNNMVSELVTANTTSQSQVAASMCMSQLTVKEDQHPLAVKPLFEDSKTCNRLTEIYENLFEWKPFAQALTNTQRPLQMFVAMSDMTLEPGSASGRPTIKNAVQKISEIASENQCKVEATLGMGSSATRGQYDGVAQEMSLVMPTEEPIIISTTLQTNYRGRVLHDPEEMKNFLNLLQRANDPRLQQQFYDDRESLQFYKNFMDPAYKAYRETLDTNSEFMQWVNQDPELKEEFERTASIQAGSRWKPIKFGETFSFLGQRAITSGALAKTMGIPLSFIGVAEAVRENNNDIPTLKELYEKSPIVKQNLEELRLVLAETNLGYLSSFNPPKPITDKFEGDFRDINQFFEKVTGESITYSKNRTIQRKIDQGNLRYTALLAGGNRLGRDQIRERIGALKIGGKYAFHTQAIGPSSSRLNGLNEINRLVLPKRSHKGLGMISGSLLFGGLVFTSMSKPVYNPTSTNKV